MPPRVFWALEVSAQARRAAELEAQSGRVQPARFTARPWRAAITEPTPARADQEQTATTAPLEAPEAHRSLAVVAEDPGVALLQPRPPPQVARLAEAAQ